MNFKKTYIDLEMQVHAALRVAVKNSTQQSKHTNTNIIPVNLSYYTELSIVDDELIFMDDRGLHYSIFVSTLEDLIDILSGLKEV